MTRYKFKIYELSYEEKTEKAGVIALKQSGLFFTSSKKAFAYAHEHNRRVAQYPPETRAKCVKYGSVCYTHEVI